VVNANMGIASYIKFWKIERPKAAWVHISATPDADAQAARAGAMFTTTPALEFLPEPGKPEPNRIGDLIFDFDHKTEPQRALDDLRRLCCFFLPETYGVDPWDIRFFCSGGKGFHSEIPARFFGLEAGHPQLPLIFKRLVQEWIGELGLTTIDLSVYCMGKGRMWRLPNVPRASTGRCKVVLSRDDVAYADLQELWVLSDSPRRAA
jgi:hypothetical protein